MIVLLELPVIPLTIIIQICSLHVSFYYYRNDHQIHRTEQFRVSLATNFKFEQSIIYCKIFWKKKNLTRGIMIMYASSWNVY